MIDKSLILKEIAQLRDIVNLVLGFIRAVMASNSSTCPQATSSIF